MAHDAPQDGGRLTARRSQISHGDSLVSGDVRRALLEDSPADPELPGIDWGVGEGPWLWFTELRILFVIDGRINVGSADQGLDAFGLGPALETIRDRSFAWWVRIIVDVATRDGDQYEDPLYAIRRLLEELADWADWPPGDTPIDPLAGVRYFGFRFNQADFDLDAYDQVWFFGDWPGLDFDFDEKDDSGNNLPQYSPLDDAELAIVAEWMDRGGGVFATGDHGTLGASMCHRIPRVRSMRRWTHAQDVPMKYAARHETLQHYDDPEYPGDESDPYPQPIEPVYRTLDTWPPSLGSRAPHPLLCAVDGVITRFPDHMHEGAVFDDDEVVLNAPLEIAGYSGDEYPPVRPVVLAALGSIGGVGGALARPRPHVIAYGRTTNTNEPSERFPLVAVYDGDPAGIGRVVVDSTWHHWFSLNVVPLRKYNPPVYRRMQAYYRNIALWLATPYQRASMLVAATWGALVASEPMDFDFRMDIWQLGERALDVIGRTAPQCTVADWVSTMAGPTASTVMAAADNGTTPSPLGAPIPAGALEHAIVGGIGLGLRDLVFDYQKTRAQGGRPHLQPEAIREQAIEGAQQGNRALAEALASRAKGLAEVSAKVTETFEPPQSDRIPIPIETISVRVIPERLQFSDLRDPILVEESLRFVVALRMNGTVFAQQEFSGPRSDPQGVLPLSEPDLDLPLITVQSGERLTIECEALVAADPASTRRSLRFRDTLTGHPSEWVGTHLPNRRQPLRLWYSIERADE
jgi:hypothetical protein